MEDLQEVKNMLEQNFREWPKQWEAKGRKEGESHLLSLLLETKFGPLRQGDREKVEAASTSKIAQWAKRVLTAATLDEVFADV